MKYFIKTYGCQFNYSDSERISAVLESVGFSAAKNESGAGLIIFNTCSIRQRAEDRVFGMMPLMRALRKRNKKLKVAITGCMVRKSSTRFSVEKDALIKALDDLDMTFRIEDVARLPELLNEVFSAGRATRGRARPLIMISKGEKSDENVGTLKNYFCIAPKYTSKFQAFVPISRGCDKFCAYCVVPYSRGREISRSMNEVFDECEKLVKNGCKEITLLGQTVDSYGLSFLDRQEKRFAPLKVGEKIYFTRLLEKLDTLYKKGLRRVRWTSPHPKDLSDDLIDAVARLRTQMPYIHLPVQAGSNAMLKKMNRPYTVEHYIKLIKKIRMAIPCCAISTDIIIGFCGETEKMFKETCDLYEKIRWDMAYISQYSMRRFTAAYKTMKDTVPRKTKEKHWHILNNVLKRISFEKHKEFVGKTVNVLVETCKKGICEGRSEHFKRTQFPGSKKLIGRIVPVKVVGAFEWNLIGEKV